jgi:peptidoglycan/LPS O-acetylase OafA/YrhL
VTNPTYLSRHYSPLDGLRALAILLVIPHNADVFSGTNLWAAGVLAHVGWVGVQLFFVLSGFLITGNLLDSQGAPNYYQSFFARRILRIFPLYYGVLIIRFFLIPHLADLPENMTASAHNQVWLWTFLVNWTEPFGRGVTGFSHFWSLAVEEQFYFIWPFLVRGRSAKAVLQLSAALILMAFIIRCTLVINGAPTGVLYMFTFCRMDALAAGAAAAALMRMPKGSEFVTSYSRVWWITGIALLAAGAIPTSFYALEGNGTYTIGYTILSLAFAALMIAGVIPASGTNRIYQKLLSVAPLRSVGRYSYGMYVFHMLIITVAGGSILSRVKLTFPNWYPVAYAVTIIALSYGVAFISYHGFEKHFLKLKQRFTPTTNVALQPTV